MTLDKGIYVLGDDTVFDQCVALFNSIEANVSAEIPVALIPYTSRTKRLSKEIIGRKQIEVFENRYSIKRWESFARQVWANHPKGRQRRYRYQVAHRILSQRRYTAFDGPFKQFVYFDADTLAMKPLDGLFSKLTEFDVVFDDWEHGKKKTALDLNAIESAGFGEEDKIRPLLHCSSFFGSKKGLFDEATLEQLLKRLVEDNEVEWVSDVAEAFLFTYNTFRAGYSQFNFTLSENGSDRTGNCADADEFNERNHVLFNRQSSDPIHRIHYMNYSPTLFSNLAKGVDANVAYKKVFLYYRFKNEPAKMPTLSPPNGLEKFRGRIRKFRKKLLKRVFWIGENLGAGRQLIEWF